jgi:hypothetical protein
MRSRQIIPRQRDGVVACTRAARRHVTLGDQYVIDDSGVTSPKETNFEILQNIWYCQALCLCLISSSLERWQWQESLMSLGIRLEAEVCS